MTGNKRIKGDAFANFLMVWSAWDSHVGESDDCKVLWNLLDDDLEHQSDEAIECIYERLK